MLRKSLTQTLKKKPAIIVAMHKSCGSLQAYACGFRVYKTNQTYVTLAHILVSNHAPKKQLIMTKKNIQMSRSKGRGNPNSDIVN